MKVRQHFQRMKAKQKPKKAGLHVLSLPPDVANIYEQMHKPRFTGQKVSLRCPYCKTLNIEDMPMCCDLFRAALVQIMKTQPAPVMVD
jgi:hypothetical protein